MNTIAARLHAAHMLWNSSYLGWCVLDRDVSRQCGAALQDPDACRSLGFAEAHILRAATYEARPLSTGETLRFWAAVLENLKA